MNDATIPPWSLNVVWNIKASVNASAFTCIFKKIHFSNPEVILQGCNSMCFFDGCKIMQLKSFYPLSLLMVINKVYKVNFSKWSATLLDISNSLMLCEVIMHTWCPLKTVETLSHVWWGLIWTVFVYFRQYHSICDILDCIKSLCLMWPYYSNPI